MDVQVKAGSLVHTIVDREISGMVGKIVSQLQSEMTSIVSNFLSAGISAVGMHKLENHLAECTRYQRIGSKDPAVVGNEC